MLVDFSVLGPAATIIFVLGLWLGYAIRDRQSRMRREKRGGW